MPDELDPRLYRMMIQQVRDYALFLLDPTGHIISWNAGAQRIKGYAPAEIIGRHFSIFYTPDALERGWPAEELRLATREGRFEDEGWRVRKDGSRFWANVVITALRDDAGRLLAFSKITRDLTERKRQEEALRQAEERFRLLIEGVVDYGIFMLDPDGMVTSWNVGAERILRYARGDIIGSHFSRFYADEDIEAGRPWEELARARRLGRAEDEGWRVRSDGERFWARVVVTALHDAEGRLRGFAEVTQDLTERRHLQDLESAAKRVNEFLATLAHELRNPLAPIRNAAEAMGTLAPEHPAREALRQTIQRQSGKLARIVDDMLDIARITRGELHLRRAPLDLAEVVRHALETAAPAIESARHQLEVDLPGSAPLAVEGDIDRLTQLLANVLNNAARYTPPAGRIRVQARRKGAWAEVEVRDNGRGIEPAMLEHVFDMFVQERSAVERAESGLGIGLAVARRIAEAHGGSIEAHSDGAGRGSLFRLRLPLADKPPAAHAGEGAAAGAAVLAKRILVVDDNADAASALEALLRSLGHEARFAQDGARALEMAAELRPEVVLLDIAMPGMDGYEVARKLRALPGAQAMRIVAITGWGQEADRARTRAAGFDLHLVKPVDPTALSNALEGNSRTLH